MPYIILHMEAPEAMRRRIEGELHQIRRECRGTGVRAAIECFESAEAFQAYLGEQSQSPTLHESRPSFFESNTQEDDL